ncbi:MAG: 16S rRNA (cytosine(1402)-N(4))-methyltransferase RsmH, partial [Candidatus Curtissbacteria bacterium]|nr:16S rRNA (cytosine(1402)-N(4))-methyltransferase RsmH [Candidatus Curtissbacteria bacterium]
MDNFHTPILLHEIIDYLQVKTGKKYIDATLGGGGCAREILKLGGIVLGVDCDPEAIEYVKTGIRKTRSEITTPAPRGQESGVWNNLTLVRGNFKDLSRIADLNKFGEVSGIIFDLGVSTHQLLTLERGFSFSSDAPLDMRMDPMLSVTAADLINGLGKGELYELFSKLGEDHAAWAISQAVVRARTIKQIKTCRELADLVSGVKRGRKKTHPATQIFQALR